MPWQRPNIGSRGTREGHARFWGGPGAKVLRATRQLAPSDCRLADGRSTSDTCKSRNTARTRLLATQQGECLAPYTSGGSVPRPEVKLKARNGPSSTTHRMYRRKWLVGVTDARLLGD